MHELAIAESVVGRLLEAMETNGYRRIETVCMRIGKLTDVVPDALEFGFQAATRDTPLENTQLKIEEVPIRVECHECAKVSEVENYVFVCPGCHGYNLRMIQGDELDIAWLDVDTGDDSRTSEDTPPPTGQSASRSQ